MSSDLVSVSGVSVRQRRALDRSMKAMAGVTVRDPSLGGVGRLFTGPETPGAVFWRASAVFAGITACGVGGLAGAPVAVEAALVGLGVCGALFRAPLLRSRAVNLRGLDEDKRADFEVARQHGMEAVVAASRTGGLLDAAEVMAVVQAELWTLACLLRDLTAGGAGRNTGALWREVAAVTARLKALESSTQALAVAEAERAEKSGDGRVSAAEVLAVRAARLTEGVQVLTSMSEPEAVLAQISGRETAARPAIEAGSGVA